MGTDEERQIFSRALSQDRVERGMSQFALARELKVVHQTLSKWERGTTLPRDYRIHQIVEYFGKESHTAAAARDIMVARDRDAVRVAPEAKYIERKPAPKEVALEVPENTPEFVVRGTAAKTGALLLERLLRVNSERRLAYTSRLLDAMAKAAEANRELEALDRDLDDELGEQ